MTAVARLIPYAGTVKRWMGAFAVLALIMGCTAGCTERRHSIEESSWVYEEQFEAPDAVLHVRASELNIRTADRVRLELEVMYAEGASVEFPAFHDTLGKLRIVTREKEEAVLSDEGTGDDASVREARRYTLEPFLPGNYEIPPLRVTIRQDDRNAQHYSLVSNAILITVSSVLEDAKEASLRDIAPMLQPPPHVWWPVTAVLVVIVLAAIVLWFRRRGRQNEVPAPLAPDEQALARLSALEQQLLGVPGEEKRFYTELSSVVREFIEARYGVRAPELTTEEFLVQCSDAGPLAASDVERLNVFLAQCDLVKFAGYELGVGRARESIASARAFIAKSSKGNGAVSEGGSAA